MAQSEFIRLVRAEGLIAKLVEAAEKALRKEWLPDDYSEELRVAAVAAEEFLNEGKE